MLNRRASGETPALLDPRALLGPRSFAADTATLRAAYSGRRIVITGGAGSIGREIAGQLAAASPQRLTLLDRNESGLYMTRMDLERGFPGVVIETLVGDILDPKRLEEIFCASRPAVVFHAAAFKQVPMMEENEVEAFRNNVLGTLNVAAAASATGAARLVLISTDKAVNPAGIMGATKRLAEKVVTSMPGPTAMVCVRFGNVLASDGSVVRVFERQIAGGGPVTVTHPEASRFFMTIEEAVGLLLQAGAMGAAGDILCLDMGRPVGILSLARHMIERAGPSLPGRDVGIVFTGLRPGEKLHEESLMDPRLGAGEPVCRGIIRYAASGGDPDLIDRIRDLHRAIDEAAPGDRAPLVRRGLAGFVPEFDAAGAANAAAQV